MDFTHLGEIMSINDVSAGGADDKYYGNQARLTVKVTHVFGSWRTYVYVFVDLLYDVIDTSSKSCSGCGSLFMNEFITVIYSSEHRLSQHVC